MMAIETPASTANRMLDRPLTTSPHDAGSPQSNSGWDATWAPNIPSTASPRAMSTPTIRSPTPYARRRAAGVLMDASCLVGLCPFQQPDQQRLLRMQAVLRLIPDHALR